MLGLFSSSVETLSLPASNQEPQPRENDFIQRPDKNPDPYRILLRENVVNASNKHKHLYLFLENYLSGAISLNKHVRVRKLILPAWVFSVKEGEMHDLKHFCVI